MQIKNNILYHGSKDEYDTILANSIYPPGSTSGKPAVYATNMKGFALAYAGEQWDDFTLSQALVDGTHVLVELFPGSFKKIFDRPGFLHYISSDDFKRISRLEWVCFHDVTPIKIERINNVLLSLKRDKNTKLYFYPVLPKYISSREEYLKQKCEIYGEDYDSIIRKLESVYGNKQNKGADMKRTISEKDYKNITELYSYLKKCKYGMHCKGKLLSGDHEDEYTITNPDLFDKLGGGTCFDYAIYQHSKLDKLGYKTDQYFIWMDQYQRCHTMTVTKVGNIYLHIECADKLHRGVYIGKTQDELINRFINQCDSEGHVGEHPQVFKIKSYKSLAGLTFEQYIESVTGRNGTHCETFRWNKNISKLDILIESTNDNKSPFKVVSKSTVNPNDTKSKKAVELSFLDDAGTKIGGACISSVDTDDGFLYNLNVNPVFRGRGYANVIMRYILSHYRVNSLSVSPDNKIAISLYKKFGFKNIMNFTDYDGKDLVYMQIKKK